MEYSICPNCGSNVDGLLHHCDCCGLNLNYKKQFLFFSCVAWQTSATIIMNILRPVELTFVQRYGNTAFSETLDQIAIIPLCYPNEMHQDPEIARERRYVTQKNRYADLRIHIPYEKLIHADRNTQLCLCADTIKSAAAYIEKKDKTFQKTAFLNAVSDCFYQFYGVNVF